MTLIRDDFKKEEIVRTGLLYTASGLVSAGISMVGSLYIIYHLTIYEYGVFRLVLSLIGLFQVFLFSGFNDVIKNDIALAVKAKDRAHAGQLYFEFFTAKFFLAFTVWAAFFIFVTYFLSGQYYDGLIRVLQVSSLFIFFRFLNDQLMILYGALGALSTVSRINPLFDAINVVTLITILTVREPIIWYVILANVISQGVNISISIFVLRSDLLTLGREYVLGWPRAILAIIRAYGKWSIFTNILSEALTNGRNYIIKFLISTEAVALFNVASSMYLYLALLFPVQKVLANFLPYKLSSGNVQKEYFALGVKYSTYIYLVMVAGGAVGGSLLVHLFLPKYTPSLPVFYVMLLSMLVLGVQYFCNTYLHVFRQQRAIFFRMLAKVISAVVLLFSLTPFFGLYALGIEHVATNIAMTVLMYWMLIRMYPDLTLTLRDFALHRSDIALFLSVIKKAVGWRTT